MKSLSELERQFREECTVINMGHEYPGYIGTVKWIIITDYSRNDLEAKFMEVLKKYSPYEICPVSTKDAIAEYNRNEDKFRKRQMRNTSIFDLAETVDAWCPAIPSFVDAQERAEREEREHDGRINAVRKALSTLTEIQLRRLCMYHLQKMTYQEIATAEGVKDHKSVRESVKAAEKKFKNVFQNTPQNGTPLSKYSEEVISLSGLVSSSALRNQKTKR